MRLRFTIRDLLWLAALVALTVAWWVDRAEMSAQRKGLNEERLEVQHQLELLDVRAAELNRRERALVKRPD